MDKTKSATGRARRREMVSKALIATAVALALGLVPAARPAFAGDEPTVSPPKEGKTVFVTSQIFDGDLGGLAGADEKCNQAAAAAGLKGTFKAWLSDSETGPADRFVHAQVPYVRTDGVPIADNWDDLVACTSGPGENACLDAPFTVDENGTDLKDFLVQTWSNTGTDGKPGNPLTGSLVNCANWTTNDPEVAMWGTTGQAKFSAHQLDADWTGTSGVGDCRYPYRLYCFEQ
jgi:hypothetical protein